MKPIISIIMPLYNAARFLEETLVSISEQTFQDYELVCINDGSNDNTVNIVQKFQERDSRIKILHNEERCGAAAARNRGIRAAKGKYLVFLDGDDIFDEEMLTLSYEKAEKNSAEIVMFEAMHVQSEDIYKKRLVEHSKEYISKLCKTPISVNDIKVCDFLMWSSGTCNKLFLREFINNNHLEFQNLSCDNDTYFVDMAFFLANRIILLDSSQIMLYARDHFTSSRISTERDPMCIYYAMAKVKEELKRRSIFQKVYKIYNYRAFNYMIVGLKGAKNAETRENFFNFLVREGFNNLLAEYGHEYGIDRFLEEKKNAFIKWGLKGGWEKVESSYEVFLEENLEEIRNVFVDGRTRKLRIGIWGAGENGRKFITFCNKYNMQIDLVIDMDETKQGQLIEGYCIRSPQAAEELDIILFTPRVGYAFCKEILQNYSENIKVIDLNSFMCMI